jgi:hypothetical protein
MGSKKRNILLKEGYMAKHYAIAYIHGMYSIYEQVCDMLAPDDIVYFLGDTGD